MDTTKGTAAVTLERRALIAAGASWLVTAASPRLARADGGFDLLTPADVQREQAYVASRPGPLAGAGTRALEAMPSIDVVSPMLDGPALVCPLRIELRFGTFQDAHVVPASFRLLYGFMKIDLTGTVLRNATLTERGLVADNARVPAGTHRLFLQLADDRGRANEREIQLRVSG